jgi:hypothetical protein
MKDIFAVCRMQGTSYLQAMYHGAYAALQSLRCWSCCESLTASINNPPSQPLTLQTTTRKQTLLLLLLRIERCLIFQEGFTAHPKTRGLYTTTGSSMCPKWPGHSALPSPHVVHLQHKAPKQHS